MFTTTTRRLRTGALGLTLSAVLFSASAAQAQTLDEIINASLEAAGGREAMGRITSVKQSGSFTMSTGYGDIDGDTEVVIIPNQKLYQDLNSDLFQQTGAWNGTTGWQSDTVQGTVDVTGQQAESLAAQTVLHPFLSYNAPEYGATEYRKLDDADVGGRSHHVVEVSTGSITFEIFVDAETKLVSRLRFDAEVPQMGTVKITADASGYEEHGGVMLATRNSVDIPGVVTIDTRMTTVDINVEVDHAIFEKP